MPKLVTIYLDESKLEKLDKYLKLMPDATQYRVTMDAFDIGITQMISDLTKKEEKPKDLNKPKTFTVVK